MHKRRIRLLFVIGQLIQGGTERYLFEVCSALDRRKFDIDILTRTDASPDQYYAPLLAQQGVTIHRLLSTRGLLSLQKYLPILFDNPFGRKAQLWLFALRVRLTLGHFFSRYDLVNVMQIENYALLHRAFSRNAHLLTFLMSHRVQYTYDPYADCLRHRTHHFVTVDHWQRHEIAASACVHAETTNIPLVLDFSNRRMIEVPDPEGQQTRIGIFSRLSSERPLEFFFHAIQRLCSDSDVTLYIYGGGDPQALLPLLAHLGVRERVIFMGHQPDLEETIRRDKLSVVWMISIGAFIGYGSIETAGTGMPVVFWSLRDVSYEEVLTETGGAMHAFTDVDDFVAFNRRILHDRELLRQVGRRLREHVLAQNDIRNHIARLESHLIARATSGVALDAEGEGRLSRRSIGPNGGVES